MCFFFRPVIKDQSRSQYTRLPRLETFYTKDSGSNSDSTNISRFAPRFHRCLTQFHIETQEPVGFNGAKQTFSPSAREDVPSTDVSSSVKAILCKDYSSELKNNLPYSSFIPYFTKWTISGFKHDKVWIQQCDTSSTRTCSNSIFLLVRPSIFFFIKCMYDIYCIYTTI